MSYIAEWWQFAVFALGGYGFYIVGRERQRFQIDQIGREVNRQSHEIEALKAQGTSEAITLAGIVATQAHIMASLEDIKETLKEKADK